MKKSSLRFSIQTLLLLLCAVSMLPAQSPAVAPADIIVIHGRVYTENPKQPWAQAVAIRGEKIVAVGDDSEIEKMHGMSTKVIDAGGKLVLPGLVDCHVHFLDGAFSLGRVNLEELLGPAALTLTLSRKRERGSASFRTFQFDFFLA